MASSTGDPQQLLHRSLESGRIHSAYLLSGPGGEAREAALAFARALVCSGPGATACEECPGCVRSAGREEIAIDGTGRRGPLFRHIGDHPDLLWVERGAEDSRVRIGQIRAVQNGLRLGASEGGRRAVVIADAEWLNQGAQNALLRLLEEPPERTTLILVSASSAGLLATVRSRCQKLAFRSETPDPLADPENAETAARLARFSGIPIPDLLDWAEEFRGARAPAAAAVEQLLDTASAWLRQRVRSAVSGDTPAALPELDAHRELSACRKSLAQRNANPQMVAERALLALREAAAR